jgi:hypothetical protein
MKTRLLSCLCVMGALAASAFAAEPAAAPVHATTVTKSAIRIGNGTFALVKGTKLEVLGREGDNLIVKFRSMQGKIPLAETDFNPDTELPEAATATPVTPVVSKPAAPAKPVAATPAAPAVKAATPPALSADGKPASTYGKAVQKAKQVTETQKSTRVDPTKEIMDEQPK